MPNQRNRDIAPNQENLRFDDIYFPTAQGELDEHYMDIDSIRYRYQARANANRKEDRLGTIRLPLPNGLGTAYGGRYNNEPLGVIGKAAAAGAIDFQRGYEERGIGGALTALKDRIETLEGEDVTNALTGLGVQLLESDLGALVGALVGGIGGGLATLGAQQALQGALAGIGVARNPHEAVLFQGVDFRTHPFTYKLVPRNEQDSEAIRSLIFRLKQGLLPAYEGGNHFFSYPNLFKINFSSRVNDFLFEIGPSFLTNLSVDYHGEGLAQYARSVDGAEAPISVSLNLTFAEATLTTREDIREVGGR